MKHYNITVPQQFILAVCITSIPIFQFMNLNTKFQNKSPLPLQVLILRQFTTLNVYMHYLSKVKITIAKTRVNLQIYSLEKGIQ